MLNHDIKEANKKKNCPDCLGHHLFNLIGEGEFIIRYQEWLNYLHSTDENKWKSKIDCSKTYYDWCSEDLPSQQNMRPLSFRIALEAGIEASNKITNQFAPLYAPDEEDFESFYELLSQYIGLIMDKYYEGQIKLDKLDLNLINAVKGQIQDRDYIPAQWFYTFVQTILFPYAFEMSMKSFFTYWKLVRQVRLELEADMTEDLYDTYLAKSVYQPTE